MTTPSLALTKAEPVAGAVIAREELVGFGVCTNCGAPLILIPFYEVWTHQETGNRRCAR